MASSTPITNPTDRFVTSYAGLFADDAHTALLRQGLAGKHGRADAPDGE
jgi:hypothetical protein